MPNTLFETIHRLPPTKNSVDLSSLPPDREAYRDAFLSQKKEPYAFLCGHTPVWLFFDADGAPLDALLSSYLRAVFHNSTNSHSGAPAKNTGGPRP